MFQAPDFTKSSGLSKPHAARVLKKLMQHNIVKMVSPARGRKPALYGFAGLIEIIESEQGAALDRHSAALQCVKKNCESISCCTKDEGRPLGIDVRA